MVDHVPKPWGLWNNYNWELPWLNVWKDSLGYFWFLGCMWSHDDIQTPGATHPGQTTGAFPASTPCFLGPLPDVVPSTLWASPMAPLFPTACCACSFQRNFSPKVGFLQITFLTYFINWKIKHLPGRKRPYNLKSWKTDHYSERIHLLNKFVSCTLVYPQKHSWPFTTSGLAEEHTKGLILCDTEHP